MTKPPPSVMCGVSDRQAFNTPCPKCGANPKKNCTTPSGLRFNGGRSMHIARYRAAPEAAQ